MKMKKTIKDSDRSSARSNKKVTFPEASKLESFSPADTFTYESHKTSNTFDSGSINVTTDLIKSKFISVLDHLDSSVEKFRTEALVLVKKRDFLLTCIELLKDDEQLVPSAERKKISKYHKRINRVYLQVSTIRNSSQEKSLEQVNVQINLMIAMPDSNLALKRCQMFLNAFGNAKNEGSVDIGPIDRNFESALLGCTIDDQREIRQRLEALLDYLKLQCKQA